MIRSLDLSASRRVRRGGALAAASRDRRVCRAIVLSSAPSFPPTAVGLGAGHAAVGTRPVAARSSFRSRSAADEDIPGGVLQAFGVGTRRPTACPQLAVRPRQRRAIARPARARRHQRRDPCNDPVVRITIQAGCDTSVRREYTLFMDPPRDRGAGRCRRPAPSQREVRGLPPPEPPRRAVRRAAAAAQPRTPTRSAQAAALRRPTVGAARERTAPQSARHVRGKPRGRRPPRAATRPRLSVSSGGAGRRFPASLATEADRERARQERANAIEAETAGAAPADRRADRDGRADAAGIARAGIGGAGAPRKPPKPAEAAKTPADRDTVPRRQAPASRPPRRAEADAPAQREAAGRRRGEVAGDRPPVPSWWEQNCAAASPPIVGLPLRDRGRAPVEAPARAAQDESWRTAVDPAVDGLRRSSRNARRRTSPSVRPHDHLRR